MQAYKKKSQKEKKEKIGTFFQNFRSLIKDLVLVVSNFQTAWTSFFSASQEISRIPTHTHSIHTQPQSKNLFMMRSSKLEKEKASKFEKCKFARQYRGQKKVFWRVEEIEHTQYNDLYLQVYNRTEPVKILKWIRSK